jgi:thiol-disulfide isomerase/thioredoxin
MGITIPDFTVQRWLNSPPLTAGDLHGRVVLIDFWEYTCINWIRTAPFVRAWHRDYSGSGLVVIGLHAPEFEFGTQADNIERAVRDQGLSYPIALDNDFSVWRALGNTAWPAKYLFDFDGRLMNRWLGEGGYDQIETEIRHALTAAYPGLPLPSTTPEVDAFAATGQPSYAGITEETYLGRDRREPGTFELSGDWRSDRQYIELQDAGGEITLPFTGGEVNLIAQPPPNMQAPVTVLLDGQPIDEARGSGVDADAVSHIDHPHMVPLVAGANRDDQVLTLLAPEPGLRLYAFTFGP